MLSFSFGCHKSARNVNLAIVVQRRLHFHNTRYYLFKLTAPRIKEKPRFFVKMLLYDINGTDYNHLEFEELPEIWRDWYRDSAYRVSTLGSVCTQAGHFLEVWKNSRGYATVFLPKYGRPFDVHKMVIRSHRLNPMPITNPIVDHIDGNRMNCRLDNLRYCNIFLNGHNKRGVKGFTRRKRRRPYEVSIRCQKRKIALGCFETEKEARETYLEASGRLYEIL